MQSHQKTFWFIIGALMLYKVGHGLMNQPPQIPVRSNPKRKGGWSAKKIRAYNLMTGSKLKHGVDHDPITLEDFKRKGSWATRHYKRKGNRLGLNMARLKDKDGELTPFSTQAVVWGEKPPKNRKEQKRLVRLGEKLLKIYQKFKAQGLRQNEPLPLKIRKRFKRGLRKKV